MILDFITSSSEDGGVARSIVDAEGFAPTSLWLLMRKKPKVA